MDLSPRRDNITGLTGTKVCSEGLTSNISLSLAFLLCSFFCLSIRIAMVRQWDSHEHWGHYQSTPVSITASGLVTDGYHRENDLATGGAISNTDVVVIEVWVAQHSDWPIRKSYRISMLWRWRWRIKINGWRKEKLASSPSCPYQAVNNIRFPYPA